MRPLTISQQKTLLWVKALVKIKMKIMVEKLKSWTYNSDKY